MAISFAADIRPLFRDGDLRCMGKAGVKLDDLAWMSVPANASVVYDQVSAGTMPPDKTLRGSRSRLAFQGMDGCRLPRVRELGRSATVVLLSLISSFSVRFEEPNVVR